HDRRPSFSDERQEVEPAHTGEAVVEKDDVHAVERAECLFGVAGGGNGDACQLESSLGEVAVVLIIVHHEDAERRRLLHQLTVTGAGCHRTMAAGRTISIRAPAGASTRRMVPPSCSTIFRQAAKPIPVPSPVLRSSRRSKTPKTRSRNSAGTPRPSSETNRRAPPSGSRSAATPTLTSSRPPW